MSDINGTAGDDRLVGTSGADVIDGGAGKDRLNGGDGDDVVFGGDGNDYVYGDAGNDKLYGGSGNDAVVGDAGNDEIYGEDGNDGIFGGGGNDYISGGSGVDTIYGDGGNDIIDGGEDGDKLYGGSGDDKIYGGNGDDIIDGGAGNDTLVYVAGTGNDTITGGVGYDTVELVVSSADLPLLAEDLARFAIWLDARTAAANGDLASQASSDSFTFNSLDLTVSNVEALSLVVDGQEVDWRAPANAAPTMASVQLLSVDEDHSVKGSVGATDSDGNTLTHVVTSGPANGALTIDPKTGDFVYTPAENFSGTDSFEVEVTDGNGGSVRQVVTVEVNAVADTPNLTTSDVSVVLGGQTIVADGTSTVIYGTIGSDVIVGTDGDDILYSSAPADATYEVPLDIKASLGDLDGSENLTIIVSGVPEGATLSAGQQIGEGQWQLSAADVEGLTMTLPSPTDTTLTVTATASEQNGSSASTSSVIEVTFETAGSDGIEGGDVVDILRGGGGDDVMYGGDGFDYVDYSTADNGVHVSLADGVASGDGNDSFTNIEGIIGSGYSDTLIGDGGNNIIYDGAGSDSVSAGAGDDIIVATADGDHDHYRGGSGIDIVDYSNAQGAITVDLGNGLVRGASGKDNLYDIEGVIGGSGNDTLLGGNDADILNGGAGDDTLRGGRGADLLTGGEGSDTFEFARSDLVSGKNYYGYDTITDFGAGDRLDFTGLESGGQDIDADDVRVTDTEFGTMVAVDMGGKYGYVDVVMLEGVHGVGVDDLISSGQLIV